MSLPVLTPLDTPIFDEDVIAELEEHFDDTPTCKHCEESALVRPRMKCCGASTLWCVWHRAEKRGELSGLLLAGTVNCLECSHTFGWLTPISEVLTEVPL